MKTRRKSLYFVLLFCFSWAINGQFIQVNDTYTAKQLVQNVLVGNSSCAGVSNFFVSGGNFGNGQNSYGYFNAGTSGFPFSEGIVLSTSKAISTQGPNASILSDTASGWIGDPDLNQALGITNTSNATILEFDFTPLTSTISFDYVFASEEYHGSAPCTYSDGFAFLLKVAGSSDPYQNLALVPNTLTPVKVTTVHPAVVGSCPAINEAYFGSYNSVNSPTNFNGQTVIMKAQANVIPGTIYHIKLVIADETNPQYDSAIFLGANSFNIGSNLGADKLIASNNPICEGDTYDLDATIPGLNSYKWYKNGSLTPVNSPVYNVRDSGDYKVEITLAGTSCIASDEITIEYSAKPILTDSYLFQCDDDNDGSAVFDLTKANSIITGNNNLLGNIVYFENINDANPIPNLKSYKNTITNTVYGRVSNSFGCVAFAKVTLQISNKVIGPQNPILKCDGDGNLNGFTSFNLNNDATPQILLGLPSGLIVEYYLTSNDALIQQNQLPNNYTNATVNEQIVYARIVNGPDCFGITPIKLMVTVFSPPNFEDETVYICNGNPKRIAVTNNYSDFRWSNGDNAYYTSIAAAGNYSVTVTNVLGCLATKKFIAINSETAIVTSVDVVDFSGSENSILINYTGIGVYEFSIDGVHFQNSPQFYNVPEGSYLIAIRDSNGCGITTPTKVFVLDYPRFFSPNGDSYNDFWAIKNSAKYPNMMIYIYNRYGKLITQVNPKGNGWDGTYNGQPLPADDYWFSILLNNDRNIKGYFTLFR